MSKSRTKTKAADIQLLSITYEANGKEFTVKPSPKPKAKVVLRDGEALDGMVCTPGDTKCEDGQLWRCFDIGGGQSDWLTAGETC